MTLEQQIKDGATIFPHNEKNMADFLNELSKQRQSSFVCFKLILESHFTKKEKIQTFLNDFEHFILLSQSTRRLIINTSIFRIWFKHVADKFSKRNNQSFNLDQFSQQLNDFGRIKQSAIEREKKTKIIQGTTISLARYEVDKCIAEVTPPTFTFPSKKESRRLDQGSKFPLNIFSSALEAVLHQIDNTCPLFSLTMSQFVDYIIHLDQANFRSCSADRYIGVIFLTASDTTLIDIEESVIHEFGHQVLYNIMELDSIVINNGKLYKLPWSGSERDFYGYFHAFYIYTLLITHFVKKQPNSLEEGIFINQRIAQILEGCKKAEYDFNQTKSFTSLGVILYENLKKQIKLVEIEFNQKLTS